MARGYGKIILFGEHSVVYGYPALAAGLTIGMRCEMRQWDTRFSLSIPAWGVDVDESTTSSLGEAFRIITREMHGTTRRCRLVITPEIPSRAGLGSSAAVAVSIIRTLLEVFQITWTEEKVNEIAFKAEKAFHGTPSGIDNTVATYGGLCYLGDSEKLKLADFRQRVSLSRGVATLLPSLPETISLVVVNTGKERETKAMVEKVRKLFESKPDEYKPVLEAMGQIVISGYSALVERRYKNFGDDLTQNHCFLQKLQVSCKELDIAVDCALKAGAWGAKLTGAGGGGCMIAYAPGNEEGVMAACQKLGFQTFVAKIQ